MTIASEQRSTEIIDGVLGYERKRRDRLSQSIHALQLNMAKARSRLRDRQSQLARLDARIEEMEAQG